MIENCATVDFCTRRYDTGRNGCNINAIVLRSLQMSVEQYFAWIKTSIPKDYETTDPKSVHYVISHDGNTYNIVDTNNTAWAIDNFDNGTYPLSQAGCGNAQYIYIGLEGADNLSPVQFGKLVDLICCIALKHNIMVNPLHIITEADLDPAIATILELPNLLLGDVNTCVLNGGRDPLPNIGDLEDRIEDLEECCENVTSSIASLETAVSGLPQRVTALETRVTELEALEADSQNRIGTLEGQITALTNEILSLTNILQDHQSCIDIVCPKPNNCLPITYTLEPRQSMHLTPNVPVWVNFPNKVEDTVSDSVLTGPLWTARLTCECNYAITVTVGLEPSEYCAGKDVWLDVVACGNTYRVQTITPGEGNHTVMLTGSIPLSVPPQCNDVHVMVGTNDVTTPFKVIRYGNINIRCV